MTPFGPGGEPRAGIRPWVALVALVGALAMVPLMFADRTPVVLDRVADDIENRLPTVVRDGLGPVLPDDDVIVHVVLFAFAAIVVGLMCWSWRTFALGQLAVFGVGLVIELLQPVFTSSRDIQEHDAVANAIGQALGIVAVLVVIVGWAAWERRRSPH